MGEYYWTRHSEFKMKQYALGEQRVRRVIRHPDRVEKSIVPGMVAVMQIAGTSKNRQEIWVMYEVRGARNVKHETPDTGCGTRNTEHGTPDGGRYGIRNMECGMSDAENKISEQKSFESGFAPAIRDPRSVSRTLSPAQKFRLQRQQEFLAKKNGGGEGGKTLRIISVWRYPGTSPERDPIPIEILEELRDIVR